MSELISDAYRAQLAELHSRDKTWGTSALRWIARVVAVAVEHKCADALDYGCGKALLKDALDGRLPVIKTRNYDPATFPAPPAPADLVICLDVLEHIEPEKLDAVLADLARLTRKVCFAVIATRPAIAKLPDGRNAHLIVQPAEWWAVKIAAHFDVIEATAKRGELVLTMRPA